MSDRVECKDKLRQLAQRLDTLSRTLGGINNELRPIEEQYTDFIREHEAGLWDECERDGKKLPGKEMRLTLALNEMPTVLRGKYRELVSKRESLKQQIGNLKVEVDSWRSLLSAEKAELEAIS